MLSSASCKSNEMDQSHITHNNLPLTIGNKFRNQINQNTPPDVLNVNQQRYYHDILDNFTSNTNYNNLKIGTSTSTGSLPTSMHSSSAAVISNAPVTVSSSSLIQAIGSESNLLNSFVNNHNNNNENR